MDAITGTWKKNQGGGARATADRASQREGDTTLTATPATAARDLQGLSAGKHRMGIDETQMIAPAPHQAAGVEEPPVPDMTAGLARGEREHAKHPAGRAALMKDHPEPREEVTAEVIRRAENPETLQGGDLRGEHAIKSGNLLKTGT